LELHCGQKAGSDPFQYLPLLTLPSYTLCLNLFNWPENCATAGMENCLNAAAL
jgi:hypothetical protein